jgi:hypothetical protein
MLVMRARLKGEGGSPAPPEATRRGRNGGASSGVLVKRHVGCRCGHEVPQFGHITPATVIGIEMDTSGL